jgi:hypothetical protein
MTILFRTQYENEFKEVKNVEFIIPDEKKFFEFIKYSDYKLIYYPETLIMFIEVIYKDNYYDFTDLKCIKNVSKVRVVIKD